MKKKLFEAETLVLWSNTALLDKNNSIILGIIGKSITAYVVGDVWGVQIIILAVCDVCVCVCVCMRACVVRIIMCMYVVFCITCLTAKEVDNMYYFQYVAS